MNLTKIVFIFLIAIMTIPSIVIGGEPEAPTIYVIKQGDTLWGLSERFIKDPNYWPQMWAKNSQITNPHFIYPGQKVRIFPDRIEFVPKDQPAATAQKAATASSKVETVKDVAPEKSYTVSGTEGFLMESDIKPDGIITNINHGHAIAGIDDTVYTNIGANKGAKGGERYSIFKKDVIVKHPITDKTLGIKIIPLGTLQLTDTEAEASRAIITSNYREITKDAYLLPPVGGKHEISLKASTSELSGYIVESFHGTNMIANGDVVYTDLGTNQGAEKGNMLYIVRDVTFKKKFYEKTPPRLPQEVIGAIVIVEVGNNTSTALVVKSVDTIYKGDKIVSVTH